MEELKIILEFVKILVWPILIMGLVLLFRSQLNTLLHRLSKVQLPGGGSFDFSKSINEARKISDNLEAIKPPEGKEDVPKIPLTDANKKMIEYGLQPSPSRLDMQYYRNLAQQDPNIALAGLIIEVDIMSRNLAKGFNIEISTKDSGIRLLNKLNEKSAITTNQKELAIQILEICNQAIHGQQVSVAEALNVIDIADKLRDQYISWLSWGFNNT
ncbi:MAG: hypothetical protein KAV45_02465 [Calditrichia bacterium]|nr:hypothetical protein [Calditrichia bacterium]